MANEKRGKAAETYFGFRTLVRGRTVDCLQMLDKMKEHGFNLYELLPYNLTLLERSHIENLLENTLED